MTQHRALGRDPDPPLLCVPDGEMTSQADEDPPPLRTVVLTFGGSVGALSLQESQLS